jgi:hypothetical protein
MEVIIISKGEFLGMIEENNKKLELLIKDSQKTPKETKEFLTTKEVCDMFNTSRQNLYNKQKEGVLNQYKFGNKKYYKYHEIKTLILNKY